MVDLHLFAFNCNESFRIVVDKKEKRAKLFCLTLSISLFYLECFRINLLSPPDSRMNHSAFDDKHHCRYAPVGSFYILKDGRV